MRGNFNELVLERIEIHHQRKDIILVVSGAYTVLLKASLRDLPIDFIIGTNAPTINERVDAYTSIDHVQSKRKLELILQSLNGKRVD